MLLRCWNTYYYYYYYCLLEPKIRNPFEVSTVGVVFNLENFRGKTLINVGVLHLHHRNSTESNLLRILYTPLTLLTGKMFPVDLYGTTFYITTTTHHQKKYFIFKRVKHRGWYKIFDLLDPNIISSRSTINQKLTKPTTRHDQSRYPVPRGEKTKQRGWYWVFDWTKLKQTD